ncbi:hypothetical protein E2C01_022369 [Portunus trituberculatus]|uniref:Uncharacterized protein n=1 Tax=Portunus trituberculatus TaxID=210409 RepID=A0A5B7E6V5_PORTR|nr:hypothetical protein [Portunus trituberculatus]
MLASRDGAYYSGLRHMGREGAWAATCVPCLFLHAPSEGCITARRQARRCMLWPRPHQSPSLVPPAIHPQPWAKDENVWEGRAAPQAIQVAKETC